MTDWGKCPVTRAMLSIYKNRGRCPFPEGCQFWDKRTGGCGVRLMSEAARGELLLHELNRLGCDDIEISSRLDVARSTVSKWRHGKVKVPERRMCQLELVLAEILDVSKDAAAEDIAESRAYHREEITAEVRRVLRFLNAHGWGGSRVAQFCGVARTAVSKWRRGLGMPTEKHFEALMEKYDEVSAEYKSRNHGLHD